MKTTVEFYDLPMVTVDLTGDLQIGIPGPKGDKGDKGDRGDMGLQGPKGEKGDPGVYVGSGEMPEGYYIQIDPEGETPAVVYTVNGKAPDENGNVEIPSGGTVDPGVIKEAVDDYLEANPPAQGAPGKDGYTPVKGKDYFTDAEVQEIAKQAAALVEVPDDDHINSLINTALGVIENGTY